MPVPDVYYFGRGSENCLAFECTDGDGIRVFIGNGKAGEKSQHMLIPKNQITELINFLTALQTDDVRTYLIDKFGGNPERFIERRQTNETPG